MGLGTFGDVSIKFPLVNGTMTISQSQNANKEIEIDLFYVAVSCCRISLLGLSKAPEILNFSIFKYDLMILITTSIIVMTGFLPNLTKQ